MEYSVQRGHQSMIRPANTIIVLDGDPSVESDLLAVFGKTSTNIVGLRSIRGFQNWLADRGAQWDAKEVFEVADYAFPRLPCPCCLIVDLEMDGQFGLDWMCRLRSHGFCMPMVFTSRQGTFATAFQVAKKGATDFLPKPIDHKALYVAITDGLEWDRTHRAEWTQCTRLRSQLKTLTERERQVLQQLCQLRTVKQIARGLGTSPNTIRNQRASIRRKLNANSDAELTEYLMLYRLYLEPYAIGNDSRLLPRFGSISHSENDYC